MLHAQFLEKFVSRLRPSGLYVLITFQHGLYRFVVIPPFPFERIGQDIIESGGWVLPVPPGVVVQLCLAFRREMYFHPPKLEILPAFVNSAAGRKRDARTRTAECIYLLIHRRLILEKTAILTLQRWGNSLAVRIPSSVAKSAGFKVGQPVEVSAQDSAVLVSAAGEPRLTLKQRLALFDPERHGGEAMATVRAGREAL